jgi:predicted DNA-binding transcriptional regulator AlpA
MTATITLTRPDAAALCGLSPSGFDAWVRKGIVPPAMPGTRRWSRAAIELALARAHGAAWEEAPPALDAFQQWETEEAKRVRRKTEAG